MPKFTYRLDSLLRMRCAQRDERRTELAQAFRAAEILHQQREEVTASIAAAQRQRAVPAGALNVDMLIDVARHEFLLSSQRKLLEEQSERVAAEIERRRQSLVAADQQVRVLEKLKETHQQRHHTQELAREQLRLDEIAQRTPERDMTVDPS